MSSPITKLSILIPLYNEQNTIIHLLNRIAKVQLAGIEKEIVIVDDCSTDQSVKAVESFCDSTPSVIVKLYKHQINKGKGAAIHTAIQQATGEYFVVQDADLEYDPEEYQQLLIPVFKDNADVVYGSRFVSDRPRRVLFFWHMVGNKFLTFLSNMFTNLNLTDMETCYKLVRRELCYQFQLRENRFGFDPEITAKLSRIHNVKFYEVGISYYGRTYEEGKKISWKDGFRVIYCILKYGLFRRS